MRSNTRLHFVGHVPSHKVLSASEHLQSHRNINLQLRSAACTLFVAATAFIAFGATIPRWAEITSTEMGECSADMACFTIQRRSSHVIARIYLGTPAIPYDMLVRTDSMGDCSTPLEGISFVITSAKAMGSSTLVCGNTTSGVYSSLGDWRCSEVVLAYDSILNSKPQRRFNAFVRVGNSLLNGAESINLGMDGEMRMCQGTRLVIGSTRACFTSLSDQWHYPYSSTHDAQSTLNGLVNSNGWIYVSRENQTNVISLFAHSSLSDAGTSESCTDAADYMALMPNGAILATQWTSLVLDAEEHSWSFDALAKVKAYGRTCAFQSNGLLSRVARAVATSCEFHSLRSLDRASQLLCDGEPYVEYSIFSSYDMAIEIDERAQVRVFMWPDKSLEQLAVQTLKQLDTFSGRPSATDTSLYRLFVMTLAALVLWTRREDQTVRTDSIFISCIDLIYHDRPTRHEDKPMAAVVLAFAAIVSRLVLSIMMWSRLDSEGIGYLVVCEIAASVLSLVHWSQLNAARFCWMMRGADDMPLLGGSSAVVDVASATMFAFAETPLTDAGDSFDDIARLLTAMLITIVCVTRTIFSASCSAASTVDKFRHASSMKTTTMRLGALFSVVFWLLQSFQIAATLMLLFVMPFANTISRRNVSDPRLVASFLFVGFVGVGACPRLTSNAMTISKHFEHHDRKRV